MINDEGQLCCEKCKMSIGNRDIYMAFGYDVLCPSCWRFISAMVEMLNGEPLKQAYYFKGGKLI
ncbi:hypothetical protein FOL75_12120 [Bacillus thuringiensis]|uniref:hypothetical protein n=1 Tax=Bacillus thuringiensis TaxID=1428 RepID=UPI002853D457|nr:hypothetical protein [Bacillus thuringiensis]MDR5022690.1 hypothetical protein [Bacillus thuringiensis]